MSIFNLKINHLENRILGIDVKNNQYSFNFDKGDTFTAKIIKGTEVVEQKEISIDDSTSFYFDKELEYHTKYLFTVENKDDSASIEFETGIKFDEDLLVVNDDINPRFNRTFKLSKEVKQARLYITALGLYQAFINNTKVGDAYLTPGMNDYDAYVRYQTYDITNLLSTNNSFDVYVGSGWYKGRYGIDKPIDKGGKVWGDNSILSARIDIEYLDGTSEIIRPDNNFKVYNSSCLDTSIYDGEHHDYNFEEKEYKYNIIKNNLNIIPDYGTNIKCKDILKPTLYTSPKGDKILDFGQNMVGFVRCNIKLDKGEKLTLKHGEILQDECFYNANLRTAKAEASYIGDGVKESFEPMFTFMGFRYVLVEGIDNVDPKDFEGVVLYSDLKDTLTCTTDNELINKLLKNAYWGQRGNFLDIPTDCPQRDERLGWTADTQVFVNTACYQMDSYNFYRKYLDDLRFDQTRYYGGDIPMYSPSLKGEAGHGGAVWADAATIIPWNLYQNYGDKKILERSFAMIKDYADYLENQEISQGNSGLIKYGFTFGDWLAQDGVCPQSLTGGTDNAYIMSVYYYNSIDIAYKVCDILGFEDLKIKYKNLKEKIYNAILDEYFAPNGRLSLDTQTSYILALYYGIYRNKEAVIEGLKNRLSKDFFKMKTGFTGTPLIVQTLFDNGLDDYAYRILFNEECPGWLYAIKLGATTIWERWNSVLPDGKISGINMNSLNHYSYGSVCEAIYSRIAGLRCIKPGFKEVEIKPHLNYRLKHINLSFDSPSGNYKVEWKMIDTVFRIHIEIPSGSKAKVILPDNTIYEVTSGKYDYECKLPDNIIHPFNLDTPNLDIVNNEEARKILQETLPQAFFMVTGENDEFKISNGHFLGMLAMFGTTKESMTEYERKLKEIKP